VVLRKSLGRLTLLELAMPIEFHCSQCDKLLRVPDESAGKKSKCPHCGAISDIPRTFAGSPGAPSMPSLFGEPSGGAATSNPFSEAYRPGPAEGKVGPGPNPYQSPQAPIPTYAATQGPLTRRLIEGKVSGPATALVVVASLALFLLVVNTLVTVVVGVDKMALGPAPENQAERVGQVVGAVVGGVVGLAIYTTVLIGALKMRKLESYSLAMTASILAMLPCSLCCVFGLPFGIWSLVVLSDQHVKSAFG
jgi:hypothetical protein